MRELGYVEKGNLAIEWRFADGNYERFPGLAAELVRMKPDVIVTHSTAASLARPGGFVDRTTKRAQAELRRFVFEGQPLERVAWQLVYLYRYIIEESQLWR